MGTEFSVSAVGVQALLVLLTGIGATIVWRRSPVGVLRWDGEHWSWVTSQDHPVAGLRMVLDLQRLVLVSVRRAGQPVMWLWLESALSTPHGWQALRRALVHASLHGLRAPSQPGDTEGLRP